MTGLNTVMEPRRNVVATTRDLVRCAGAGGDFVEMHYDEAAARSLGPPDLPVHGLLKTAWLTTLVEEWLDGRGRIRHLDVTYRRMDFRNQPIECLLAVRSSTPRGATLQLSTLNASGETTTTATATVESTPHHQPGGRFSSPLVGWRASRRRP